MINDLIDKEFRMFDKNMMIKQTSISTDDEPYYLQSEEGYEANISKVDSKKIYWYTFHLGKRVTGSIALSEIKNRLITK